MRLASAALLLLGVLLVGCRSTETIKIRHFDPIPMGVPITIHVNLEEGSPEPGPFLVGMLRSEYITKSTSSGRKCSWTTADPDGSVDQLHDVSATDDYIALRIIPAIVQDAVVAVMSVFTVPMDAIAKAFGVQREVPPPATEHGCGPRGPGDMWADIELEPEG